jgi:glycyl-tRNA synthetase
LSEDTVTLRERDSTLQVRVKVADIGLLLLQLINGGISWEQVQAKYPKVESKE